MVYYLTDYRYPHIEQPYTLEPPLKEDDKKYKETILHIEVGIQLGKAIIIDHPNLNLYRNIMTYVNSKGYAWRTWRDQRHYLKQVIFNCFYCNHPVEQNKILRSESIYLDSFSEDGDSAPTQLHYCSHCQRYISWTTINVVLYDNAIVIAKDNLALQRWTDYRLSHNSCYGPSHLDDLQFKIPPRGHIHFDQEFPPLSSSHHLTHRSSYSTNQIYFKGTEDRLLTCKKCGCLLKFCVCNNHDS